MAYSLIMLWVLDYRQNVESQRHQSGREEKKKEIIKTNSPTVQ